MKLSSWLSRKEGSSKEPDQADDSKMINVQLRWRRKDLKEAELALVSASSAWIIQHVGQI